MSETFYLCTKCHAESYSGKDHPTDLGCAIRWRTIAAEALTPVMLAKKRIEICASREHYGNPQLVNTKGPMGMCARCVTAAVAAYKMISKYVGFFSSSQDAVRREQNGTQIEEKGNGSGDVKAPETSISEDEGPRQG